MTNRKRRTTDAARSVSPQSVAIIGAGRLGTALGSVLAACGYDITSLVASTRRSAQRASRTIRRYAADNGFVLAPLALAAAELDRIAPSALYLFATPDDELPRACRALAFALGNRVRESVSVALHTSGALTADELAPLRKFSIATGSLHPLVSVAADAHEGARNLQKAFYCVEGDATATHVARRIVRQLGGRSFTIASDKKALYHAAAVIASGHTVALFDTACEALMRCGLDERAAQRVLLPLLASTLRNLEADSPASAMTGTFARADLATLRKHLDALRAEELPFAYEVYRSLGRRAVRLARENGADARALKHIEQALDADED